MCLWPAEVVGQARPLVEAGPDDLGRDTNTITNTTATIRNTNHTNSITNNTSSTLSCLSNYHIT